jgi:hypothetical protein
MALPAWLARSASSTRSGADDDQHADLLPPVVDRQREVLPGYAALLGGDRKGAVGAHGQRDVRRPERLPDRGDQLDRYVAVRYRGRQPSAQSAQRGVRLGTHPVDQAPHPALQPGSQRTHQQGHDRRADQRRESTRALPHQHPGPGDHEQVARGDQQGERAVDEGAGDHHIDVEEVREQHREEEADRHGKHGQRRGCLLEPVVRRAGRHQVGEPARGEVRQRDQQAHRDGHAHAVEDPTDLDLLPGIGVVPVARELGHQRDDEPREEHHPTQDVERRGQLSHDRGHDLPGAERHPHPAQPRRPEAPVRKDGDREHRERQGSGQHQPAHGGRGGAVRRLDRRRRHPVGKQHAAGQHRHPGGPGAHQQEHTRPDPDQRGHDSEPVSEHQVGHRRLHDDQHRLMTPDLSLVPSGSATWCSGLRRHSASSVRAVP